MLRDIKKSILISNNNHKFKPTFDEYRISILYKFEGFPQKYI